MKIAGQTFAARPPVVRPPTVCTAVFYGALILFSGLATEASAQRFPNREPEKKNAVGQFDYYAMVLSWSPTHCSSRWSGDGYDPQCDRADGKRYAFVLHGLWPQNNRGWPEYCPAARTKFVPQPIIDNMLDIMPSPKLVIHQYRKHGTCSGLEPAPFFAFSRRLFEGVKIPEAYKNPFEARFVSPAQLTSEFQAANPWLKPEMMAISCGGPGNRLREIRICLTREGQPRACGLNEDQRRLCSAQSMYVPPVRATNTNAPAKDPQQPKQRPTTLPSARNI